MRYWPPPRSTRRSRPPDRSRLPPLPPSGLRSSLWWSSMPSSAPWAAGEAAESPARTKPSPNACAVTSAARTRGSGRERLAPRAGVLGCGVRSGQGQAGGADVLAAVPGGHGGMPLARQRVQQRQRLTACGVDHQVDVLQRPLQRELRGEVAAVHLVELGVGERRVQRAALDDLGELLVTDTETISQLHGLGHALDEDGQVCVDDKFHLAAPAGLTQPYGLAADDVEHRANRVSCGRGP